MKQRGTANLLIFSCCFSFAFVNAVNDNFVEEGCLYKYGDLIINKSWNLHDSPKVDFFLSSDWGGNYYLEIAMQNAAVKVRLTFLTRRLDNDTSYVQLQLATLGWKFFILSYNPQTEFVALANFDKPGISVLEKKLTIRPNATNFVPLHIEVEKPDFMYAFFDCRKNIRQFHVEAFGNGSVPTVFFKGRTRFVLYAPVEYQVILNEVFSNTRYISLCENLMEPRNQTQTILPFCKQLLSSTRQYYLELKLPDLNQNVLRDRRIKIAAREQRYYITTYLSFNDIWWDNDIRVTATPVPSSDTYYEPLVIVSSFMSLMYIILIVTAAIVYFVHQRRVRNFFSQVVTSTSEEDMFLKKMVEAPQLPPFQRKNAIPALKNNDEKEQEWKEYNPPPMPRPPIPPPPKTIGTEGDDGSETAGIYPGYDEPTWFKEKYGEYENPRVNI